MDAEADNIRQALVEQLSSFENRLDSKIDDVKMLADIQDAIGRVLGENGANEAAIRRVLQERYESGDLRKETFQLVKSMLDRYVTEKIPTGPGLHDTVAINLTAASPPVTQVMQAPAQEDPLSSTTVIPVATAASDAAGDPVQVGSLLRDRFLLQERVSSGGMGVVYKALDRRLAEGGADQHWVAIKVLSPHLAVNSKALRALQQEAAKGRCLTHPNIVRFLDLDRDDDLYFMVMEWLDGATLAEILDSPGSGNIDQARAFEIVRQIGKALDYAHRCGIVHADVKPGNIMIMPNGDAKLFDFGIARVRQKQLEEQPDFDPGALGLMTPAYSSMQVLTGEEPAPADDVFSLACLLYRLIAGYRVFGPRNAAEAAAEGMKPQRLQSLNDAQWRVLKKALSYSRVTRFDSMADFIEALNVEVNEPITITVPARDELDIDDESVGAGRYVAGLIVLIGLISGAAWHFGYLDDLKQQFGIGGPSIVALPPIAEAPAGADDSEDSTADRGGDGVEDAPIAQSETSPSESVEPAANPDETAEVPIDTNPQVVPAPVAAPSTETATIGATSEDERPADAAEVPVLAEPDDPVIVETRAEPAVPLADFSLLPPPTAEIEIARFGAPARMINVRLREDSAPATVDLLRGDVSVPLELRLEEVRYSGNRSPSASGQFEVTDGGFVSFRAGQDRARVTLSMASDPLREADQQITLRVREVDSAISELALITVVLEDDDQREFEQTLPANTVAFATSQISVREQDPAVQIDVLRFNPDSTSLVVGYLIRDITASQGEDYFAPSSYTIEFGPYQRTARILIPLVQDSEFEDNEAFSVELSTADSVADRNVYLRTAVMIRDDDL